MQVLGRTRMNVRSYKYQAAERGNNNQNFIIQYIKLASLFNLNKTLTKMCHLITMDFFL